MLLITLLGLRSAAGAGTCPLAQCNHSQTGEPYNQAGAPNYYFGANMARNWPQTDGVCNEGRRYIAQFENTAVIDDWHPPRPGRYKFEFIAEDECGSEVPRTASREIQASCPSPPVIKSVSGDNLLADNIVKRGSKVTFSAEVEYQFLLGKAGSERKVFSWYYIKKPINDPRAAEEPIATRDTLYTDRCGVANSPCLGDARTYTTKSLDTPGDYTLEVQVTDGCSTTVKRICFKVECNCNPTAHAVATTFQNQDRGSCVSKTLDLNGQQSYDFDIQTGEDKKLTYQWDMLSWTPAPDLAFKSLNQPRPHGALKQLYKAEPSPKDYAATWLQNSYRAPSETRPGYQTVTECVGDANYNKAKKAMDDKEKELQACKTGNGGVESLRTCEALKVAAETSIADKKCFTADNAKTESCSVKTLRENQEAKCAKLESELEEAKTTFENTLCNEWKYTFKRLPREISMNRTCTVATERLFAIDDKNPEKREDQKERIPDEHYENELDAGPDAKVGNRVLRLQKQTDVFSTGNRLKRLDTVSTSCLAQRVVTTTTDIVREVFVKNCTIPRPACETPYTYCSIRITNADQNKAQVQVAEDAVLDGDDKVLNENYKYCRAFTRCRGRFVFRLTVKDSLGCSQSTDEVQVTFRCSRPPVAIAGKRTFVRFQTGTGTGSWPQVSIDGRSSYDRSGLPGDLTYVWSFLSYPQEFETKCESKEPAQRVPLVGSPRVIQVTSGNKLSDGKTFMKCLPTPYAGNGAAAAAAVGVNRIGNSAYFKPTTPGNYTVQLSVFDGCSVITDTVDVIAICPDLQVAVELDTSTSTLASVAPSKPITVKATCTPSGGDDWWLLPQGQTNPILKYAWSVSWSGDSTRLLSTYQQTPAAAYSGANGVAIPTEREASIELKTFGTYTITCAVSDGCQTKTSSKDHTVTCSGTVPTLSSDITANDAFPVLEKGVAAGYPLVTVSASAPGRVGRSLQADIEYSWSPANKGLEKVVTTTVKDDAENVKYDITIAPQISPVNAATRFGNTNIQVNNTLNVQLYAYNLCQRNPTPKVIAIKYACDPKQSVPSLSDQTPIWSYTGQGSFPPPSSRIDATAWKSQRYSGRLVRKWEKRRSDEEYKVLTTKDAILDVGIAFIDDQLSSMSIPPKTSSQSATNNVYFVKLTVTDDCTTQEREVKIEYDCTSWPTASLQLKDAAAKDGKPSECNTGVNENCVVHWNSYDLLDEKTKNYNQHGRFPMIWADVSGSVNADQAGLTDALKFDLVALRGAIQPPLGSRPLAIRDNRKEAQCTRNDPQCYQEAWRPPGSLSTGTATYSLNLAADNTSPCKSARVVKSVQTKCNKITASVLTRIQSQWTSTRFKLACIDLRNIRYVTDDVNQTQANLDSIKYTWKLNVAPKESIFYSNTDVNSFPDTRVGELPDVRCREVSIKPTERSYNGSETVTMQLSLGGYCPPDGNYDTTKLNALNLQLTGDATRRQLPDKPKPPQNDANGCPIPATDLNDCVHHPWLTNAHPDLTPFVKRINYFDRLQAGTAHVRVQFVSYNSLGQKTLSTEKLYGTPPKQQLAGDGDARRYFEIEVPKAAYEGAAYAGAASVRVQVITDKTQIYPDLCGHDLENEIQQAGNPKGGCLDAMYVNFTYAAPVKGAGTVIEKKCAATNSVEYCTTHKTKETKVTAIELANHHYNRPYTCFRPDVKGLYSVSLDMDDGCTTVNRNVLVDAECPAPVTTASSKITVEMRRGEVTTGSDTNVAFDGQVFTRVILDARRIETEARLAQKSLDFEWSMAQCPMKYDDAKEKATPGWNKQQRANQITNHLGAKASFIPTTPGTYKIQLKLDDHCNEPQTIVRTVYVNCSIPFSLPSLTVQKGKTQDRANWAVIPFNPLTREGNLATVRWPLFDEKDKDKGKCRTTPGDHRTKTIYDAMDPASSVTAPIDSSVTLDGDETKKVDYLKQAIAGIGCWSGERFRFSANMTSTCSTTKTRWLISERKCARPYTPSIPTVRQTVDCPQTEYDCKWHLTGIPCDFKWNDVGGDGDLRPESCTSTVSVTTATAQEAQCIRIGLEKVGKPTKDNPIEIVHPPGTQKAKSGERDHCNRHFKCRHPGTYSLKFTVYDGCTEAVDETSLSCLCATTPTVRATRTLYTSLYQCNQDIRRFQSVEVTVNVDEVNGFELKRCEAPTTPKSPPGIVTTCPAQCPSASVCPQCPQCPQCPPCGTEGCNGGSCGGSGSLGQLDSVTIVAAALRQHAETARALAARSAEQTEISYGPVMGVILPMSAVMLLSIFGNLLLFSKISARRNRKAKMVQV